MGGALVTDGVGHLRLLDLGRPQRAADGRERPGGLEATVAGFGTGPLGLVTVLKDDREILVTRDGIESDIQPMPAEMAADSTLFYDAPNVAVGDRSVVVLMWSGTHEARIPSLWVGTPEQ